MSESIRTDQGPAWLYVAALDGVATDLNEIFVKVGRSNDIRRRENDLNFALPRRLGLRWRMVTAWRVSSPAVAHLAEQTILQSESTAGRSAGGEFLVIRPDSIAMLRLRCRMIVQTLDGRRPHRLGGHHRQRSLAMHRPARKKLK